ncbi:MAG: hypothetical protein LQ351_002040 [Letrouitia transgressa]|nr:MAG: hypothetical protein LQ351_002040 [Letrouitia transgressa]
MSSMLSAYGFRKTLRAYAIASILLALPLLYFVKPRIPVSQTSLHRRLDPKFLVSTTFWIPQLCNIVQGLGYFIPSIYLPSYTKSLGMTQTEGTLMVALVNVGVALGAVWVGALIDRIHVSTVMAICSLGAGLAVFLLWGLGLSLPLLSIFSLLYGLTAGGFSSNYTGIVQDVKEKVVGADPGMVFGFLAAGRGIGAVASGPLSEALFDLNTWKGDAKLGYGTGYGLLIVFTGVTTVTGGGNWAAKRLGWL